ncbi:MAG: DUF5666 domain-containing protein [Actinomycetota bacterium]|nr:DUF5666 domain-containing protein [Actinomycetota bacterium]
MEYHSPAAVHPWEGDTGAISAFGPPPDPPAATSLAGSPEPHSMGPSRRTWLAGGLAAALFGIGGLFGIQAVTHHSHATAAARGPGFGGGGFPGGGFGGGVVGTFGSIRSISGTTLTLSAPDGSTVMVATSSSTAVTKAAAGAVADIKAGDHIVVRGRSEAGGVTAALITDRGAGGTAGDPGAPPGIGNSLSGTVASVGNGTFTVAEAGGNPVKVSTTASTVVTVIQPSDVLALAVGDNVQVSGPSTNGTVAAISIESGAAGVGPGGPGGGGPGGGGGFAGPPPSP